jgi:hypothetical protein
MPKHATLDTGGKLLLAYLPEGVGSSSASVLATTITVPSPVTYSETVIASATATASSKVRASLAMRTDAENDIEHAADIGLSLFAQPEEGQIRFVLTANSRFTGPFPVIYEITP